NDHITRHYTQSKKVQWLKQKMMLAQLQEAKIQLSKEQLAILADTGEKVDSGLVPTAQASFMANLSSCDSEVPSKEDIDTLKQTLSNHVKEKESLSTTLTVFKTESKEKESKYIDKEISLEKLNKELENTICKLYRSTQAMHMLTKPQVFYDDTHKQALGYQNPYHHKKAQRIKPTLYEGSVIAKEHAVISVIDDEETLILEEENRSKMLDKQNDPISVKHKINISPIDYSKLNNLKEDFGKRFVTQQELSAEQAFWLKQSNYNPDTSVKSHTPVRIKALSELPKVSLVNERLKKLKYHLASFDKIVKKRTTSDAISIAAVDQCSVDKNAFEIENKELKLENKRLLEHMEGNIYSMEGEDEFHDDNTPPPPPPVTPTQQAPHTLSTIKLPIMKKGAYDIWVMKMEHYLEHTEYPIWEVVQKGDERERKARTTLLMAIPEDHLAKFHKMTHAKEMWEAIKSRFGGNNESKKMQKYIMKQQFESFSVSNSEGLHKGYDRFQSLLSQLEIHGAGVSTEDANQKFLRSLPASWSQVSLIMRTKPGVDTLSFDDLYNNLRVFKSDIKGSTTSSSSTQNVAFVSFESTNSTNDVSTAYGVSTSSGHNSQKEGSSSYTDELKYSFFANQSSSPQLDHEDLEQKTGRRLQFDAKEPVGFDKTKAECFNCHNTGHFARECRSKGNQERKRRDAVNTGYKAKDNGRRPGKFHCVEDTAMSEYGGIGVSTEDANQKFLRSLPASGQSILILKASILHHLHAHRKALHHTLMTPHSTPSLNHQSGPQLDYEDLEQVDEFDLEEMDLKWQVAMISMRLKKFYKKTGRRLQIDAKELVGFDKTKVECFNYHNTCHFAKECRSKGNQESRRRDAENTGYKAKDNRRRPGKQEEPKALVTLDEEGVDWIGHAEDEQENFALMAYSNSGSDTEVTSCSKECVESFAKLKKLYDTQREQLGDASIEIQAYTQALKKVKAQLVALQKNQLWYEEKIRFIKIDLDDKTDVLTYHKKLLAEFVKEKKELNPNFENFQSSSKGLSKLLNSQMSTWDKSGLGYGNQIHEGVLSYEKEVLESVFNSMSSDVEDSPVYDRYEKVKGMHAVPPPMTGNYMPPKYDFGINESNFTYGLKQSKTSESDAKTSDFDSCETNSSVETLESVPEPVIVKPKVVSQPKVWSDAPIIEEYESDSDDEYVIKPLKEQEKPSFAFVNIVKHVKTPRETVKEQNTCSPSPKDDLQKALKNKGIVDSRCSRHMTGNKAYLVEYQDYNGGPVAFGGSKGYISGKGKIKTRKLDFEDVCLLVLD
ncbi:ribonuclease H-like domain-containing protein, partial [Tanacetum coccineum]